MSDLSCDNFTENYFQSWTVCKSSNFWMIWCKIFQCGTVPFSTFAAVLGHHQQTYTHSHKRGKNCGNENTRAIIWGVNKDLCEKKLLFKKVLTYINEQRTKVKKKLGTHKIRLKMSYFKSESKEYFAIHKIWNCVINAD